MKEIITTIANEINEVLQKVDEQEVLRLEETIQKSKRIFIAGTGRSGLIGKVFAMRLMHSGYDVFIVGETTTPSIQSKDILLIISGSGNTATLVNFATKASEIGAKVAVVTTNKESEIGVISNLTISIPAATKKRLPEEPKTIQPLGSQFDQVAHLLLDALIVHLTEGNKKEESLLYKHANLE